MSAVTWIVEADWDRDTAYEAITGDVERPGNGISIKRGFGSDGLYKTSNVSIDLGNRAGTYSPGNTGSARHGQIRAGVPVRVKATHNAIDYVLWTGYIKGYKTSGVQADQVPICTIDCSDLSDLLAQYTPVNVLLDERTTDEAYEAIAVAIGLDPADYNFPAGAQTMPIHWVRNKDAFSAFADVLQSELGGIWYVDADNVIQGLPRSSRLGISADQTWGDGTSIVPKSAVVEIADDHLVSTVAVQANVFVRDEADQVIASWSRNASNPTPDSVLVLAGQPYEASIDYGQPVESVSAPVAGEDYTFNSAIDGSGTDLTSSVDEYTFTDEGGGYRVRMYDAAANFYVTNHQVQGLAVGFSTDKPVFKVTIPIPGEKIDRGYTVPLPYADDTVVATRHYAMHLLRAYRYEFPVLTLVFDASTDDKKVAMLSLELGNLIFYKDTAITTKGTYSNDWWYVQSINHEVPPDLAGQTFTSSVTLVPSYLFRNLDKIIFDDFQRANVVGDLGTTQSGATWASDTGFDIASNKARPNSTGAQLPNIDLDSADCVVEVSLSNLSADADEEVGVIYRYADTSNYWRAVWTDASDLVRLTKRVAGVSTNVASFPVPSGPTGELRVIVQGDRHRVWWNRKLVLDHTDSAINTNTRVGLFSINTTVVDFADFFAEGL